MSNKGKGSRTERELLHLFWESKWWCLRVAGSGSMPFPCPDLLAGKRGRSLAVECKSSKGTQRKYITKQQIQELQLFAEGFGAKPWVGIRFNGMSWLFLKPKDLGTGEGKHYFIDKALARAKGISFKELIAEEFSS